MTAGPIVHPSESASNAARASAFECEPKSLRTFTPTQAVIARTAGCFHWTPEGRRLFDFTSGVLVANLGHNPNAWTRRFFQYMGWPAEGLATSTPLPQAPGYFPALADDRVQRDHARGNGSEPATRRFASPRRAGNDCNRSCGRRPDRKRFRKRFGPGWRAIERGR